MTYPKLSIKLIKDIHNLRRVFYHFFCEGFVSEVLGIVFTLNFIGFMDNLCFLSSILLVKLSSEFKGVNWDCQLLQNLSSFDIFSFKGCLIFSLLSNSGVVAKSLGIIANSVYTNGVGKLWSLEYSIYGSPLLEFNFCLSIMMLISFLLSADNLNYLFFLNFSVNSFTDSLDLSLMNLILLFRS